MSGIIVNIISTCRRGLWMFCVLVNVQFTLAQEEENKVLDEAAANATNPVAFVTKLQVQPNFAWKPDNARQVSLVTRLIQPAGNIGLPFIRSKDPTKIYTLYRLELPVISQTYPQKPSLNATGLSDIGLVDLIAVKQKWGLWGAGPALIIPTFNPAPVSAGKWCIGLTGLILNTKTKGLQFGMSVQQYYSFAGSGNIPARNFMLFQPILNKILDQGYFIGISPFLTFDWGNGTYNIPVSVNFGKAFAKNLSAFIAPQYVISGPNQGDFILQFQINAMFPPSVK
jgi:hypothetical protein